MKITENCIINNMPENVYHGDPTPELVGFAESTSASSSTLRELLEDTPQVARAGIRRLNKEKPHSRQTTSVEKGDIAHDYILLNQLSKFEIAPFDDWRKDAAKEQRDDIIARGKIPLNLSTQSVIDDAKAMKDALFKKLSEPGCDFPLLFRDGAAEQSAFAFDGQIWNRARIDWLDKTYDNLPVDYKTTALSFDKWIKYELWDKYIYQALHYVRVLNMIHERNDDRFLFVVQQSVEPYDVAFVMIDKTYHAEAQRQYDIARVRFIECTKTGIWPGVPAKTIHACPPPWKLADWELRDLDEKNRVQALAQAPVEEDKSEYLEA